MIECGMKSEKPERTNDDPGYKETNVKSDTDSSVDPKQLPRRTFLKASGVAGAFGLSAGAAMADVSESVRQSGDLEYIEATIPEIRSDLVSGEISAETLIKQYLARIEEYDATLNAFITVNPNALDRAAELDQELEESGPAGPLHGIPVVLKDNYDTSDMPTTGGSLTLEGFVPEEDAFLVTQLREAGAVVLGKGNMDEWAHGGAPAEDTVHWVVRRSIPMTPTGGHPAVVVARLRPSRRTLASSGWVLTPVDRSVVPWPPTAWWASNRRADLRVGQASSPSV